MKATRLYKPDDGDDQMNENDEDVVPADIVSNLKNPRIQADFVIRHRHPIGTFNNVRRDC